MVILLATLEKQKQLFCDISEVMLQTRVINVLLQHDKRKTRKQADSLLHCSTDGRHTPIKVVKLEVAVCRRHFLRQQDATAGIYHHAGPSTGLLWRENGGTTLPACSLRRSVLGRRHLGCSR